MELINATGMQAGYTMGLQPDGRELLVVVVKGTFTIPAEARSPTLARSRFPWSRLTSSPASPACRPPSTRATTHRESLGVMSCLTAAPTRPEASRPNE